MDTVFCGKIVHGTMIPGTPHPLYLDRPIREGFVDVITSTLSGFAIPDPARSADPARTGCAEVRLTFLPHGPPAAALIFRIREVHPCPYLEYWLARQRACSQCALLGVEKRRRRSISHGLSIVPTPTLVACGVCITIWSVHCSAGCSLKQSSCLCIPTDIA